ncbi:MAG: acetate--CoA ligase family protein [bacterium]
MIIPLHNPFKGKLRVFGYASGSGKTLWKVLELERELMKTWEGSPFEVVGIFSDNPGAQAIRIAKEHNFPHVSLDIREYYRQAGRPLRDREVRAQYDAAVLELIRPFRPDLILLAGYVWATTDIVVNSYPVVNVHPADLSVCRDGRRVYAGANGIGDALDDGKEYLASTSHIATRELDSGPLLMISPPVTVDKTLRFASKTERDRHYLGPVNSQSRLLAARTVLEIARGSFGRDEVGCVYYRGQPVPAGIRIRSWEENQPHHLRATAKLIRPESIAVIGASAKGGIGQAIVRNIRSFSFPGAVCAVNRKGENVLDVPGYASVGAIPEAVDMAVLAVPAQAVLAAAEECGRKGVKILVCVAAGFRETGVAGAGRERELMEIVNRYNMRLLGPNCMGVLNTDPAARLNATILQGSPQAGGIGFVTQSGAIGAAMVDSAAMLGLGFSVIASLGNQPDINVNDLLPLLAEDERTKVVLLYLEALSEPARFARNVALLSRRKPVIVVKSGRTAAGAAAAGSHTGSLVGSDQTVAALLDKCGAIRADTLEEAFHLAAAFSRMPPVRGERVGVITNAGGPGILVADALGRAGFTLPALPAAAQAALAAELLPEASTGNPVDVVAPAPPEHYAAAVRAMRQSGLYDALLLVCVPPATVDTGAVAEAAARELAGAPVPVLATFFGPNLGASGRAVMHRAGIPAFNFPEQVAQTLSRMRQPVPAAAEPGIPGASPAAAVRNRLRAMLHSSPPGSFLPSTIAAELLQAYNLAPVRSVFLTDPAEAAASELSFPAVAKIEHPEIVHKSDAGGVILNIADKKTLAGTVTRLLDKFPGARGVLVQEQIPGGLELVLGAAGDPHNGHVVMAGLGGTWVELIRDVRFALVPVDRTAAGELLRGLQCYPLLAGYRGAAGANLDALTVAIIQMSQLLLDFPEIAEMDMNPVIYDAAADRFVCADFRIRRSE